MWSVGKRLAVFQRWRRTVPAHFYRSYTKLQQCGDCWLGSPGWSATVDALESIIRRHGKDLDFSSRSATFESVRCIHRLLKDEYFVETQEDKEQPVESSQLDALIVGPDGILEFESYRSVPEYARGPCSHQKSTTRTNPRSRQPFFPGGPAANGCAGRVNPSVA